MTGKGRVMGGKGNNAHLSISTPLLAGIVEKAAKTSSSPVLWTEVCGVWKCLWGKSTLPLIHCYTKRHGKEKLVKMYKN